MEWNFTLYDKKHDFVANGKRQWYNQIYELSVGG